MAAIVLTNAFVKIGEQTLSTKATNVAISMSAEAVDQTAMGATTRKNAGGVKDWSMSFEFTDDDNGSLFADLGQEVEVEVRADAGPVSATNPAYIGQALITEYAPLDGGFGEANRVALTVVSAGDLTRSTTAA